MRNLRLLFKLICLLTAVSFFAEEIYGQSSGSLFEEYLPPNPQAAQIATFTESAVNLSSGNVQVSVPLCDMRARDFNWNLGLSYNSSGIKTQQEAGIAGMGWSPNLGVITRTILDLEDNHPTLGYLHVIGDFDQFSEDDYIEAAENGYDLKPDIYHYNFLQYSGKFVLDPDGQVILLSDSDIQIINHDFDSWTIVDPQGYQYHFEFEEEGFYAGRSSNITGTTAWYLTKVEDYDGRDQITFNYLQRSYNLSTPYFSGSKFRVTGSPCTNCVDTDDSWNITNSYTSQTTLESVVTDYQTALLTYGSRQDYTGVKLDKITLLHNTGATPIITDLTYGYYGPGQARLRLESVERSAGSEQVLTHSFEYNGNTLRSKSGKTSDHWGYQSNKTGRSHYPPLEQNELATMFAGDQCFGFPDRDPDTSSMMGLLSKIIYPTGWYEEFEFENHKYGAIQTKDNRVSPDHTTSSISLSTQPNATATSAYFTIVAEFPVVKVDISSQNNAQCNNNIDGLCYARLIIEDDNGTEVYNDLFTSQDDPDLYISLGAGTFRMKLIRDVISSSHIASATLHYHKYDMTAADQGNIAGGCRIKSITSPDGVRQYKYITENHYSSGVLISQPRYSYLFSNYRGCGNPFAGQLCQGITFVTNSYLSTLGSDHISYTRVEEYLEDDSRTDYQYDFIADDQYDDTHPFTPVISRSHSRGDLQKRIHYKKQGIGYQIVQIDSSVYESVSLKLIPGYSVFLTQDFGAYPDDFKAVSNYYDNISKVKRKIAAFYQLDDVITNTAYSYNDTTVRNAPTLIRSVNSDGSNHSTRYKYNSSYSHSNVIRDSLVRKNRLLPAYESIQTVNTDTVDGQRTLYSFYNASGNPTTSATVYLYSSEQLRREVTWNTSNVIVDDGWVSQRTLPKYQINVGKPAEALGDGWQDPIEYTWTTTGQLDLWKFINHQRDYNYHSNTALLQSITEVDGTITNYTYDDLLRLRTTSNCQGVTTTIAYHYTTGGGDKNYIQTYTSYPEYGEEQIPLVLSNKQFMDGIGREIQSLRLNQASGDPTKHLATWTTYDNVGRPTRQYDPQAVSAANYTAPSGDYVETLYEASPLNRPISSGHSAWYPSETNYGSNIANEVNGYAANTLNKFVQKVPTHTVGSTQHYTEQISYTDKRGRQVLMRTKDTESNATTDTYKTYDDKDRLYQVVPPDASTTDAGLIFTNLYYPDDNIWMKKVPDRDWEEFVFDDRDLLAYRQDGYLKDKSQWMAARYDPYGRLTHQGFYNSTPAVNNSFDAASIDEILLDNEYGTAGIEKDKLVKSEAQLLGTTGSITRNLGYDACGRQNHITGNTIKSLSDLAAYEMTTVYDDADHVLSSTEQLNGGLTILNSFDYDHAGRQSADYIKINNLAQQQISASTFTAKEQLESLTLGNNLQVVNNNYLPVGFLESINNPSQLGNDLWAMELGYDSNTSFQTPGTEYRKDGTITSVHWKVANESKQGANYNFDYLQRITSSDYFESGKNGRYDITYEYEDDRGNLKNITRQGMLGGTVGQIDNLNFTYYSGSNQVKTVTDAGTATVKGGGYKSNAGNYTWDSNGAIMHDPSRKSDFEHNYLDLPIKIEIPDSNGYIQYLYDATGQYHGQQEYRNDEQVGSRLHIGSVEYVDGIVDQILTSQGYIELEYDVPTHVFRTGIEPNTTQQGVTVKSEASVINNRTVIYEGGQYVWLDNQFKVDLGGDFEAWIKDFAPTGFRQFYGIRDQVNNTRIIFSDLDNNGTVNSSEIVSRFENYPYGAPMEGDWTENGKYNHIAQGQELQRGFGLNYMRYDTRFADRWIPRFLAVDRIAGQFPHVSTYNVAENKFPNAIDLHGLQAVSIHSRSFAPFDQFGHIGPFGPYRGDGSGRNFSTSSNASYRIAGSANLNLAQNGSSITGKPQGSIVESHSLGTGRMTESEATMSASIERGSNLNGSIGSTLAFSLSGNNDLVPGSPDIDVRGLVSISVAEHEDGSEASISGRILGDQFPNSETFLTDQSGQSVFLNTFETPFGANAGPAIALPGNTQRDMGSIPSMRIRFDRDGNIANISSGGKIYSIDAWNAQFQTDVKP